MQTQLLLPVLFALVPAIACSQQAGAKTNPAPAIRAAGNDVQKLLQLGETWTEQKLPDDARKAFKRVIELDPDNAAARAGLGHQLYDGKWFEGHTALFDYKRKEDQRMARLGKARVGDGWAPIADAPFLRLGWQKDADGTWVHPLARLRRQQEQDLVAKGCQQQDLEWVDPSQFEQWKQGLWKCGEQWLDNAAADTWHADQAHPWTVASEHFVITTTVDRARVEWCKWYADQTYEDLVRIFGVAPGAHASAIDLQGPQHDKPELVIWNSLAQYNKFANSGVETDGLSSLHYAFFADALFDGSVKPPAYAGVGVGFWDNSAGSLNGFGQHAVRHAAALSFVEAIDPSWKALGDMAMGTQAKSTTAFWAEKQIPRWLRFGAASYVERYFLDKTVGEGGNPRWSRNWAMAALQVDGGLRDINKVFEFKLTTTDLPGSTRLIHEAGLLVAFLLDGNDPKVHAAHEALRAAMQSGAPTTTAIADLQKALLGAKSAISKFLAE